MEVYRPELGDHISESFAKCLQQAQTKQTTMLLNQRWHDRSFGIPVYQTDTLESLIERTRQLATSAGVRDTYFEMLDKLTGKPTPLVSSSTPSSHSTDDAYYQRIKEDNKALSAGRPVKPARFNSDMHQDAYERDLAIWERATDTGKKPISYTVPSERPFFASPAAENSYYEQQEERKRVLAAGPPIKSARFFSDMHQDSYERQLKEWNKANGRY